MRILSVLFICVLAGPANAQFEVLVTDSARIAKVSSSGAVTTFATGFSFTTDLAIESSGNVLVADNLAGTIRRLSPSGTSLGVFASPGVSNSYGLTIDSVGNVYVTGSGLRKYSPAGSLLFAISTPSTPTDVVIDLSGNLLVPCLNGGVIQKYSPTGANLGPFASGLTTPFKTVMDSLGNVYCSQDPGTKVQRFSSTGSLLGTFASGLGSSDALAFDLTGNLLVGDNLNNQIHLFSAIGADLGVFATGTNVPIGMVVRAVPEPAWMLAAVSTAAMWWLRLRRRDPRNDR